MTRGTTCGRSTSTRTTTRSAPRATAGAAGPPRSLPDDDRARWAEPPLRAVLDQPAVVRAQSLGLPPGAHEGVEQPAARRLRRRVGRADDEPDVGRTSAQDRAGHRQRVDV